MIGIRAWLRSPGREATGSSDTNTHQAIIMKKVLLVLLLTASLSMSSCLGTNNAFNGLNSWNSRVTENKWVNELIFIGLWAVPAYEIAIMGDVLIFNTMEWWGAKNPIDAPPAFTPQK